MYTNLYSKSPLHGVLPSVGILVCRCFTSAGADELLSISPHCPVVRGHWRLRKDQIWHSKDRIALNRAPKLTFSLGVLAPYSNVFCFFFTVSLGVHAPLYSYQWYLVTLDNRALVRNAPEYSFKYCTMRDKTLH